MINVMEGQSLLDIATQEDGSLLCAFDWAIANNLSITDEIVPGQKLVSPKSIYRNNDMANYFKNRNQKISAALTTPPPVSQTDGIGSMIIETTFIVR